MPGLVISFRDDSDPVAVVLVVSEKSDDSSSSVPVPEHCSVDTGTMCCGSGLPVVIGSLNERQ
jgi:hypothetical protein